MLNIRRYFIVTLLALAAVAFYSAQNDVLSKTTGGGPSYSDGSSDGKSHDHGSHDHGSSDDSSSGHKKKKPKKEWRTDGNANIDHDKHFLGTTDEADIVIKADNDEKMRVTTDGVVVGTDSSILSLDVNGMIRIRGGAPWAGLVLTAVDSDGNAVWQSISVNDADSDPLNELQTLSQSGNSVTLSNGGGMISVVDNDSDSANELQSLSRQAGSDNLVLSNGGGTVSIADSDSDIVNELNTGVALNGTSLEISDAGGTFAVDLSVLKDDADADPTNELNTAASLTGTDLNIADTGGSLTVDLSSLVDDADADPANEIQALSQAGTNISLSNGGGTVSVGDNDNNSSNELQTMSQSGTDVTLSNGGGTVSVADNDNDSTNEIQTLSKAGTDVTLSGGGGTVDIADNDNDNSNENNITLTLNGTSLELTDSGGTLSAELVSLGDDADADPNNELNTAASLTGTDLEITDAGGSLTIDLSSLVNDVDADPLNEIQTLSQAGTNVSLSNGGGTVSVADNDNNSSNENNIAVTLTGTILKVTDAGGTLSADLDSLKDDADADPNNEFNTGASLAGTELQITDAGGTLAVDLSSLNSGAGLWSTTAGGIHYSLGKVGIGTTAPSAELEVAGWYGRTAHNNGGLVGSHNNVGSSAVSSNPIYIIGSNYKPEVATLNNMYGIGYTHTHASFITDPGPNSWGMYVGADGDARIWLAASAGGSSYFNAGNVGIGTTSPSAKLDCRGSATFNEGSKDVDFRVESNGRTHALFVDAGNDVVRAGTSAGSLSGNGATVAGTTVDYVADFDKGSTTGTAIGIGSIEYLLDGSNYTYINNSFGPTTHLNKDLGSSSLAWDDVYADNFVNISDGRAKHSVSNLKYGLREIKAMRNISYVLKKDPAQKRRLGLIAQDVMKLIPEAVKTHDLQALDEAHPEVLTKVELKTMGVSYTALIPVLIRATQEQNDLIMKQQTELDLLKKQVQLLLSRK